METPSEWAKKFNRSPVNEEKNPPAPQAEAVNSSAPLAEFPSEPFPCPACGQLLGPTCRVCVACRHAIDPAEIARPQQAVLSTAPAAAPEPRPKPVRYPWPIFFAVLGISLLVAMLFASLMGDQKAQLAMWGLQTLAGIWVFYDAVRLGIPRPLRWGSGTILLTTLILPWYLARRTKPGSPVPFVEAEVGRVTRFLAFALIVFFLFSAIAYLVQGPPPGSADLQRILMPK
jgi:hypothetical protein